MIAAAIALSVAGIAAFSVLPVMIGAIADAQGLSGSQAGYVAAADLCGFALAALAAIFWIDRINWRRAASAGLFAMIVGNLLSLHNPSFAMLLDVRLLAGAGAGTAYSVAMGALARSPGADRAFGIMVAAQIVYQVIALFLLPRLAAAWGPDWIFLTLAGTACLALPGLLNRGFEKIELQQRPVMSAGGLSSWAALAGVALFSVNLGALWTYVERIGVSAGLSSPRTGSILAASLALSVLGALAASGLGERFGRRLPFVVAAMVQLVSLALLTEHAGMAGFAAGAVLYSLGWAFAVPYLYLIVAGQDASGRMIVIAPAAQAIGAGLGPAIAASMLHGNSYLPANWLAGAALLGAMLCMLAAPGTRSS